MQGSTVLAATSGSSSGFNPSTLILIVIVIAAFYLLMIRPQARRRQQAQQRQNSVQPGARVRTTAGMYATVVAVDGDDVVLEVAPDVEVRYMKRAIMDVVSPADTVDEDMDMTPADETDTEDFPGEHGEHLHDEHDGDAESQDTVGHPDAVGSDDADESAYEQATGTKKD